MDYTVPLPEIEEFDPKVKKGLRDIELLKEEVGEIELKLYKLEQTLRDNNFDIYPLTIIADRYGGTYSNGAFLAFNVEYNELPFEISSSDVECAKFWCNADNSTIGFGDSPEEAYWDLKRKLFKDE